MFIALKGERFNANTFAAEALSRGAKYAVIDDSTYYTGNTTPLVNNTLTALQQLAHYHRKTLGLPVIALTGSNGKTTTKELIHAVLQQKYNTKATSGNYNNHIGLPLTLLSFTKDTEIGIVEMGANHQKEIAFLCTIAEPDFGYITNFGKAHLEGFGGTEGVIKGKSELYDYLHENKKTAFVNLDDAIQTEKTTTLPRYTFGINNPEADVSFTIPDTGSMVGITYNDVLVQSNLIGSYNTANICAAITIGSFFKVSDIDIKTAIENYFPHNNRSQLMHKNGNTLILDAYNANPSSISAALANFKNFEGDKIAILGDMFELGTESLTEHKLITEMAAGLNHITFYLIGKDFYASMQNMPNLNFFDTYENFSAHFKQLNPQDKVILIKGSRGMALERVLEIL